ncbi:MAG: ATP-binding cassette domain-containing protein [Nanoarchaeota archaeon]|nr:ATP-binding cassette domain-containing protein [Nanoarchaeota archaeon]MBU1030136.1 ATP-binding cassette domain-containing protein [Nanoarchaeota archaeon]MBU1850751.1 ATP-binding cassette domain-containing protein [Nanoarchaeota archaeon]
MENSLEVKNLSKHFGKLKAVNNISFNVPKGSIFAFLGPNGAGKSTSIKMFTSLTKPTKGEILLEGINVLKNPDNARKQFGIVFQDHSIDDELTAYENLKFHAVLYQVPKDIRETRISDALKLVELEDRKNSLVKTFSGGMKRRLEIARGLVHNPKILFLDEPTTGLDPQTRNSIWKHIKMLNKEHGMTIFLTTHYMPEAEEIADIVAIIDHGKITAQGTVTELNKKAKAKTLEETFLKFTGKSIREEQGSGLDMMRRMRRLRH